MTRSGKLPQPSRLPAALAVFVLAASALVLVVGRAPGAALLHVVFALGIFPLILAAMTYFTPVLTRRPAAPRAVHALPLVALAAGLLAVVGLAHAPSLLAAAALIGMIAAATLLTWMTREGTRAVGGRHPGLRWYQAALVCLLLGLLAIVAGTLWLEHWRTARRLHLHLNLLGFVGLTAIGTLQVLLPTAGGYSDPDARMRLARDFKYALAGTLLTAVGAAWWSPLALAGAACWATAIAPLAISAAKQWRTIVHWHGAAVSLAAALAGWVLVLAAGARHALYPSESRASLPLFFAAFLLPLVSGAATHLLPLWLRPRADAATHARLRLPLACGAGWRAAAFLASGALLFVSEPRGIYLAAAAIVAFLPGALIFVARLRRDDRARP
jgi:hypothetical protein